MPNSRPPRPSRDWRNSTGKPSSAATAMAAITSTGERSTSAASERMMSSTRFTIFLLKASALRADSVLHHRLAGDAFDDAGDALLVGCVFLGCVFCVFFFGFVLLGFFFFVFFVF